jgi:hypothetical protein
MGTKQRLSFARIQIPVLVKMLVATATLTSAPIANWCADPLSRLNLSLLAAGNRRLVWRSQQPSGSGHS